MKRTVFTVFLAGMMAVFGFCSCRTVPFSGRSQLIFTSEEEENNMGVQAWREIRSGNRLSDNSEYIAAVKRVGKNIAAVVNKPDYDWEFAVFENPQPNAFCLPGGKIGVYTGIFDYASNDAELAAVVGHEIGHAIARHAGERISQAKLQMVGQRVLASTVTKGRDAAMLAYGLASQLGVTLPYSRQHEYEADFLGLVFMAKAGYDPKYALLFWEKFSKLSKTGAIGEYFSTHPISAKRLERMRQNMPKALEFYRKAPEKRGAGVTY